MAPIRSTSGTTGTSPIEQVRAETERANRRLSSGVRLNRAADDGAGVAIASRMAASIASANQGLRNAGDGLSLTSVADGGLSGISDAVARVRELSVQASNGTLSPDDQKAITAEVTQLNKEIGAIAGRTKFNGVSLLNQAGGSVTVQTGGDAGQTITVPLSNFSIGAGTALASFSAFSASLAGAVGTPGYPNLAQGLLQAADAALGYINAARANVGAVQNQLSATIASQQVAVDNQQAAQSRLFDADVAAEKSRQVKGSILDNFAVSVMAQSNRLSSSRAAQLLAG